MSKPIEPKFPKRRYSALFSRNLVAPDGYYLLGEGPVTAADLSFYAQGWLSLEGTEEPVDLDPRYAYTCARKLPDGQQNDDLPAAEEENGICDAAELRDLQEHGTADAVRLFRETVRDKATGAIALRVGPEPSREETPPDDTETLLGLIREFTPVVLSHFSGNPVRSVALAATMARAALEEARKGITAQPSAPATVQPPHPDAPRLQMTRDGKVTAFGAIEAPPGYYLLSAGVAQREDDISLCADGDWIAASPGKPVLNFHQFTYARKLPATGEA
jgi:hypothetical protein